MLYPVLFTAHGSPMNAVRDNAFTRFLADWARSFPRPRAILVASAHWEKRAPRVTAGRTPETIHDFLGFPEELYALRYPAPGDPALAARAVALLREAGMAAAEDHGRGLDHGAWAPLRRIFPAAEIPVAQVSLLRGGDPLEHLALGRALRPLRGEGVLILGSGNLVHNLRAADLGREDAPVPDWAREFDDWAAGRILEKDAEALAAFRTAGPHGAIAHPTPEHYLPLLVSVGAAAPGSGVHFPFEGFEHGSLSMRSVAFT